MALRKEFDDQTIAAANVLLEKHGVQSLKAAINGKCPLAVIQYLVNVKNCNLGKIKKRDEEKEQTIWEWHALHCAVDYNRKDILEWLIDEKECALDRRVELNQNKHKITSSVFCAAFRRSNFEMLDYLMTKANYSHEQLIDELHLNAPLSDDAYISEKHLLEYFEHYYDKINQDCPASLTLLIEVINNRIPDYSTSPLKTNYVALLRKTIRQHYNTQHFIQIQSAIASFSCTFAFTESRILMLENQHYETLKNYCLQCMNCDSQFYIIWETSRTTLATLLLENKVTLHEEKSPLNDFAAGDFAIKRAIQALYVMREPIKAKFDSSIRAIREAIYKTLNTILSGQQSESVKLDADSWLPKVVAYYPLYVIYKNEIDDKIIDTCRARVVKEMREGESLETKTSALPLKMFK